MKKKLLVTIIIMGITIGVMTGCGSDSVETEDGFFSDEVMVETEATEEDVVVEEDEEDIDENADWVKTSEDKDGYYIQFVLTTLAVKSASIGDDVLEFYYLDADFSSKDNLVYGHKCFKLDEECVFTTENTSGTVNYTDAGHIVDTIAYVNEGLDIMIKYGSSRENIDEELSQLFVLLGHYSDSYAVVDEIRITNNYSRWRKYDPIGIEDSSSEPLDYYRVEGEGDRTSADEMSQSEIRTKELLLMLQNMGVSFDYLWYEDPIYVEANTIMEYVSYFDSWDDTCWYLLDRGFPGDTYESAKKMYLEEGYPEVDINELADYEIGKDIPAEEDSRYEEDGDSEEEIYDEDYEKSLDIDVD